VETIGLRKAYGPKTVLAGVDLTVARGSVFALLGPNGAGKTTTVRILATLLPADGGIARVAGHDVVGEPGAVRASISLTGQFAAVDGQLTAEENLLLMGRLRRLGRAERRRRAAELLDNALAQVVRLAPQCTRALGRRILEVGEQVVDEGEVGGDGGPRVRALAGARRFLEERARALEVGKPAAQPPLRNGVVRLPLKLACPVEIAHPPGPYLTRADCLGPAPTAPASRGRST
jgi:ABC-2 type transport system ATP-binding protein